ncbi:hypothetical protein CY34DRAFT_407763 [Suillus luteus UH-Slu-Lm8-n1]|uniref:Uncharacterized protein n=1 Tax=Suillus luteus UH-Slu-Lm8-n1 TaxID=930992 RepID=A0A0D0AUU8_9AGAM|nr:hypothetical protein CY34DRAFT_407763 [Suillus luteus UH-Slu-Lm8-n1]
MTQHTPDTSSNRSESPEAAQSVPNVGLYQFPGPPPAHIPGFHYSLPHATPGATLQNAPANAFTGAANMHAPFVNHQGPVFVMGFAPPVASQAPGKKRAAGVLNGPPAKRANTGPSAMKDDPLFEPILDQHGQPNGKFRCLKDGMVLNPDSYQKHLKTKKHRGSKLEKYACPGCLKTYGRRDACKRHYYASACGRSRAGLPEPPFLAVPAAGNSNLVPSVVVPTMTFTFYHTYATPVPQHAQTALPAADAPQPRGTPAFAAPDPALFQLANDTVPEPAEDDKDAEFRDNNEMRDADED